MKELEDSELSIVDCNRIRYNERKGVFVDFFEKAEFVNAIENFGWRCSPIFRIVNQGKGLEGHDERVQAIHIVFVSGNSHNMTLRHYQMEKDKDE